MLYEMLGVVVVNGLIGLLVWILIRRGLLPHRGFENLSVMLILMPPGLVAWMNRDWAMGSVLSITVVGVVHLLYCRRSTSNGPSLSHQQATLQ